MMRVIGMGACCLAGLWLVGGADWGTAAAGEEVGPAGAVAWHPAARRYHSYVPMGGIVYLPGYAPLPRRVARAYRRAPFVYPLAAYRIEPIGPPGIAPSWSTLRAGLDRYPLLAGFEPPLGPATIPGVPNGQPVQPGDASGLEPQPDPVASPPNENPQPSAPILVPPASNPPTAGHEIPEQIPTPPAESGPREF